MLKFVTRSQHAKCFSTGIDIKKCRLLLLKDIYGPHFKNLVKGSDEYVALAKSGRVWENYFQPGNPEPYLRVQVKLKSVLNETDKQKRWFQERKNAFTTVSRSLVSEYSHQSTAIELNPLPLRDALLIEEQLEQKLCSLNIADISAMSPEDVLALDLPSASDLLPGKNPHHVNELRNHIIASRYVTEVALANPGTRGFNVSEMKLLSAAILRETEAERLYRSGWGGRMSLGDFRRAPIAVRSNPMRIFPYPEEIPALMERYVQWRDEHHHNQTLHPLILAAQIYLYFVYIHPFADGNGRMGRVLMSDYLIRQGYLPVLHRNLIREDYLKKISDAADECPYELCFEMVETQLDMMLTISSKY